MVSGNLFAPNPLSKLKILSAFCLGGCGASYKNSSIDAGLERKILPGKPETCKLLKQSCKMFLKSKERSLDQTIAGWKSATTSDITDLLQRQTLIGRDKKF
jgi:hypothetical protein